MADDIAIKVENLSKCYQIYGHPRDRLLQMLFRNRKRFYQEFWALKNVSFEVKKGETLGIIGRNGSGKSTLLQIICGVLAQSNGNISVNGRVAALLELGSGFNPEFTGIENVKLYASVLGLSSQEFSERMPEVLSFAGIGDFVHQPIKTYSSGMVVRLAFSAIIHMDPEILVVDEALAVGDTAFQQKCLNRIRQMQDNGISVILVTHSTNTVIEFCDRAIFLKCGKIMVDGPCREVVRAYTDDLVDQEGGSTKHTHTPLVLAAPEESSKTKDDDTNSGFISLGDKNPLEILDVSFTNVLGESIICANYGDTLEVSVKIKANRYIENPACGIQISSVDGITLWSATSQSLGVMMESIRPGLYTLSWQLDMMFGGGRYIYAIGVGEVVDGEYRRYHRLDCAGHVDIIPQKNQGAGCLAPAPRLIFKS